MNRQFDLIVLSEASGARLPVEDPALGWFFASNFSSVISDCDAEWTILLSPAAIVTRDLLNRIADTCAEFSFADALAPWIFYPESETPHSSGILLERQNGIVEEFRTNKKREMREVASPSPIFGIYATRLLKALGEFDPDFKTDVRFLDLGLRALHLGAHLYAVPSLRVEIRKTADPPPIEKDRLRELSRAYYKDLDIVRYLKFAFRHPATLPAVLRGKRDLDRKSLKVTELSKLKPETLDSISGNCRSPIEN